MTTSIREQILARLVTTLGSEPSIGAPVYRSRVTPLARGEAPAVVVEPVMDQANQTTIPKLDWSMTVRASIIVRGDTPDQVADPLVAAVHQKVMSDLTVGGLAYDVQPSTVAFELIEADNAAGVITCEYLVLYRTSLTDVTVV